MFIEIASVVNLVLDILFTGILGYAIPSIIYFLSGIWKRRRTLAEDI